MIRDLEMEHHALEDEMATIEAEESLLETLDQIPVDLSAIQV